MKVLKIILVALVVLLVGAGGGYFWFHASLPTLEGEEPLTGLGAPVTVERDSLGIPTITAQSRQDAARALGYVHAQERFFQMDLLRRAGAGELAALLGPDLLDADRALRPHQFRARAEAVLAVAPERHQRLLTAYAEGVNAGLDALGARPFEYLALMTAPEPWRPEESVLVLYAMFIDLQLNFALGNELTTQALREGLPSALADFLQPLGDEWDAPLTGGVLTPPPIPTPEQIAGYSPAPFPVAEDSEEETPARGSNNWAVAGALTAHGGAMVADDMHLGLGLPNIWYRASLVYPEANGTQRRVTGVTLPGTPAVVVGSNGALAWGFTNSYGDYTDLVRLVPDSTDARLIRTPEGTVTLDTLVEVLEVKGTDAVELEVIQSPWGPVIRTDAAGNRYAFQWTAHQAEAVNFRLLDLETINTVDEALDVANASGIPAQNVVLGDRAGHIAWTIMGRLPRREGRDGTVPVASTDPNARWSGFLDPAEYPRVVNPEDGRIWTANARVVGGDALDKVGREPYVHGARAQQIRDALLALEAPIRERDLLALQMDDRALFYARWHTLLGDLLDDGSVTNQPDRQMLREALADWSGRADTASVSYRLARDFRSRVSALVYGSLLAPIGQSLTLAPEASLWHLVTERPAHLLNPAYPSWDALLLDAADYVAARADTDGDDDADEHTWGAYNTSRIAHPMADALPLIGDGLRMPSHRVNGDTRMPLAMQPSFGPSQRMVVAPGHEEDGIFHMPGGQAGHPLSPYWGAGHTDWVHGRPSPFLPGETVWALQLRPPE
ncbi:MAG: penicillin acylase family protein [Rhodothermaceae bacterium]|nr:penicillin acylase family protein [Rhodothermaceae bacterium]